MGTLKTQLTLHCEADPVRGPVRTMVRDHVQAPFALRNPTLEVLSSARITLWALLSTTNATAASTCAAPMTEKTIAVRRPILSSRSPGVIESI